MSPARAIKKQTAIELQQLKIIFNLIQCRAHLSRRHFDLWIVDLTGQFNGVFGKLITQCGECTRLIRSTPRTRQAKIKLRTRVQLLLVVY